MVLRECEDTGWGESILMGYPYSHRRFLHRRITCYKRGYESREELSDRVRYTTGRDRGRGYRDPEDDGGEHEIRRALTSPCLHPVTLRC